MSNSVIDLIHIGNKKKRTEIQKMLSKTDKLMWDFPFIWESWEIK